nr:pyridoxal phosphate-dependent aminotransferase [Novacetimonas pomaceti]
MGGGNRLVRTLLAERYGVATRQVCCTTGASAALMLLLKVLVQPGDDVLVETPGFDLFSLFVVDRGAHVVPFARTGDRYDIDPERVACILTPRTRLIIVSNLHNPSGFPISRQSLAALADIAERYGLYVVVDEVYRDYLNGPDRPPAAVSLSPRMISVSSMTKIWGLSTLRCGWIVGAPDLMARVQDWASTFDFGLSNLTHALAACVLQQAGRFDTFSQEHVRIFGDIFKNFFDKWKREGLVEGQVPDFGCIRFPVLTDIRDTLRFSEWLAESERVIVAPGEFFGAPGHVRLGFASDPARLAAGLERFSNGLRAYGRQCRDAGSKPTVKQHSGTAICRN